MQERVRNKLLDLGVDLDKTLGVAVSGGVDSMVLLHCLRSLKLSIKVYHMEHGIRGQQSVGDMEFVKKQCESYGIECVTKAVDIPKLAKQKGVSVETAARQERYEFLDGADTEFMATAHHMDDLAETVIMNLVRGSGLVGLGGIPERRGRYIRPLLSVTRSEIEKYAKKHSIEFRQDCTNEDTAYTRNYIRKEILPRLKNINEAAIENISRTAGLLREDEQALSGLAQSAGCIECSGDEVIVDIEGLLAQKAAVRKRIVRQAIAHRFNLVDVENVHIGSILELIEKGISGKSVNLKYGLFASVAYDKLVIGKTQVKEYNYSLVALREQGSFEAANWLFESEAPGVRAKVQFSKHAEFFDYDTVSGSVLRTRQQGDYIVPLGMSGKKRLSDYLSDRKVPLHKRDSLIVLAKGSEVFWVVGVGVSETSKITANKEIIKISYREK